MSVQQHCDLQLLQKFVDKKGVPGFWDVTMSIGHGDKQATYQLPLAKLMPVLQNLEAEPVSYTHLRAHETN